MDFRERIPNDPLAAAMSTLDGRQAQLWTALPGIVTSVDLKAMTVEVQPAIYGKQVFPDGASAQYVHMPVVPDVPIVFPCGGGYTLTFPIQVGDECVLQFHSRCIDGWWQAGGVGLPLDARMHDLSDATAHFGPRSQPKVIPNVSTATSQLRSDDGRLIIDLDVSGGAVTVTTQTQVVINSPTTQINGNLQVTGSVIAGYQTNDQVGLQTHHHNPDSHGDAVPAPVAGT